MADDFSPRLALPLLHAAQAQKELFHNEALLRVDMLLHAAAESADLTAAPVAPAEGRCWIVAMGATGAWSGRDGAIAQWTAGGWRFAAPGKGIAVWIADRGHALFHDGAGWADAPVRADGLYVGGTRVIGARAGAIADPGSAGAVVDSEARAAVSAILSALRAHGAIATE
jgi:hypothetical protein